ncbi:hypothetical protein Bbelb_358080 [Branchiostoma belcheri]|nr:hypothetical protein Bbelb_358080 [Branchiostoma belcheri]
MARRTTLTTASEDEDEETAENRVCSRTDLQSVSSLVLAVSCTLFGAFASQFMALSSQAGVPGLQLIFLMKLTQLLCVLVILPFVRPKLTTEDAPQALTLSATTVTDNLGTVLMFLSFVYVVPGVAFGVIQGAIPVSTACVGFLFLGERLDAIDSGGILCSAAGVVLVAVGMSTAADSSSHPQLTLAIGILLPLAAAFTKGPNNVLVRSLLGVRGVSVVTVVLYVQLVGTPALLAATLLLETPHWAMSARTAGYVIGLGLCDTFSSLSVKLVLGQEKAGVTAALMTLVIPFTILLDSVFQSHVPNLLEAAGVTLVLLGTAAVGARTWWRHRQDSRRTWLLERMNFLTSQPDDVKQTAGL